MSLDALGTGMCNGIVLTGETTDQQVMGGNIIDNSSDIFVYTMRSLFEVFLITPEGPLSGLPRLPLIGPNRLESRRSSLQTDTKTAYASKKFDDTDIFSSCHFPNAPLFAIIKKSIAYLGEKIKG